MNQPDLILEVVQKFYDKARIDILIGYHFRVISDFDSHIPRIAAFWEIQLLGQSQRSYGESFDLINIHTPLFIKRGELGRWLILFRKTLDEVLPHEPELKTLWLERLVFFENIFLKKFF